MRHKEAKYNDYFILFDIYGHIVFLISAMPLKQHHHEFACLFTQNYRTCILKISHNYHIATFKQQR